ncbi:MAG: sodium:solute symporter [Pyrinomonadaceae bacterium]|nr:sodium:solute symporter [Pyrinomonadaceae bacterium]MCX7639332.1 sodium:solute symporter [Pyrinomonadaceae bacterium]MDW8303440.1 sodium:solute symporter [Acidobacteriota bacterium]
MKTIDWVIVIAYLAFVIWDGIRLTKRSDSTEGFFLGSRSLPWWAVGLSVMATQLSAITLVGTTGQAYADGMRFLQFYYGMPLAMIILCVTVVPFFYRAKVYTAYEYLEKRFDAKTRSLTSFAFLLSRGMSVGVIIAAPSVILSIVLGWDEVLTIFVIGLSTTIYTMFGGVQAVTWTDVKQMFVIFFGLGVCLFVIISQFPQEVSVSDGLFLAGSLGKLETFDWRFDLSEKYTFWSGFFAALFLFLSYFGCDQSQVQRFLTARSVSEGRISLLMSALLKIPMQFFILLIGVMVFVFYQFHTPPIIFNRVELEKVEKSEQFQSTLQKYEIAHQKRQQSAIDFIKDQNDLTKEEYKLAHSDFIKAREEAINLVKESGNRNFNDVNYVFPTFVIENMPAGVIGLIIAAIFAAAMSSISSELNSLSTATTIDFYQRYIAKNASDKNYVMFGRLATLFWGIFACIVATYSTSLGSLIEVVNKFGSFFYGPILGVFVLAIGTKRANGNGAFLGILAGLTAVYLASNFTKVEFLWFNVLGCLVTVSTGYLISLALKRS